MTAGTDEPAVLGSVRRRDAAAIAVLAALGFGFHLPFLDRPFGLHEINAGNYFGVFARNWEQLGFWAVRGMPIGPQLVDHAAQGLPYTSHPPGFAWLSAVLGSAEWQMRLVAAILHVLTAVAFFVLLRRTAGTAACFAGALCLLGCPVLAFYTQVSYESAVLPCGLALLACCTRAGGGTPSRALAIAGLAAAGAFLDWQFGFWVLALAVVLATRSPRATLRRLALPWASALLGLGLVFAWRMWACAAPGMPRGSTGVQDLLGVVVAWGPLLDWLRHVRDLWAASFSLPLLLGALVGLPFLVRRAPRLALALLLAGSLNVVAFPAHSASHTLFHAGLAPAFAACLVALADRHRLALAAVLGLSVFPWLASLGTRRTADTLFFRELGRTLSAAAADPACAVGYNAGYRYGYYVDSPRVLSFPVVDPATIEGARRSVAGGLGARYLFLRMSGTLVDALPGLAPHPALVDYLERFPRERCPSLEMTMLVPPLDASLRIEEAWMYRLR